MKHTDDLGEIMNSIDMEAYLESEGIRYRVTRGSRGTQLNCKECPCCGNTHYKVFLNAENGLGNCFSGDCEKKFNKFSFIRANMGSASGHEVMERVKAIAREQGWRPTRVKAAAVDLGSELVLPGSIALPHGTRNLKYLENRNITSAIAEYFSLRFSQRGAFRYKDADGRDRAQDYSNRIILPIFDLAGDLVSFQGRDITGTAEKKYLFPPGFAATGSHLYNGQNAHRSEDIVMGEGAFDVMAIKIALDEQVELRHVTPVGSFGKHLSAGGDDSQLAKLMTLQEGGLKRVTIMWDAEPAALAAAVEVGLLLRKYGLGARIAVLPPGRDPNEVAASVVREAYWKALSVNTATAVRLKMLAQAM